MIFLVTMFTVRSSRSQMFFKIGVLKRKTLILGSLFNKIAGLQEYYANYHKRNEKFMKTIWNNFLRNRLFKIVLT